MPISYLELSILRENPFEERYRWFESGSLQRRVMCEPDAQAPRTRPSIRSCINRVDHRVSAYLGDRRRARPGQLPRGDGSAAQVVDIAQFRARQQAARAEGRWLGLGMSVFAERTGLGTPAFAARRMVITPKNLTTSSALNITGSCRRLRA